MPRTVTPFSRSCYAEILPYLAGKWGEIYTKFTPTRPFLSLTCILAHFSGDEKGGAAKFCASFIVVWYNNKRKNGSDVGGAL